MAQPAEKTTTRRFFASDAESARSVTVCVRAEGAREVLLKGDFTGWREGIALRPLGDGRWTATLRLLPGDYEYRLLVDGAWRDDPDATRRVPNPFGSSNCVLVIP